MKNENKGFRSRWKTPTTIAIIIFVSVWLIVGSIAGNKAEASETYIDFTAGGATFVGGERYESESLTVSENFADKYEVGFSLQLRLDCIEGNPCKKGEVDQANQSVFFQRVNRYKDFQIGIGVAYQHNQSPAYNTHTPFILSLRYYITKDLHLGYWHKSCAGICSSNGGLDFISMGYSF